MNSSVLSLLFSFRGRIGRRIFLKFVVGCGVGFRLIDLLASSSVDHLAARAVSGPVDLFWLAVTLALVWIGLAAEVRRLHDFGWSGWRLTAPLAVALVWALVGAMLHRFGHAEAGRALMLVGLFAAGGGSLILYAMMLFRNGDEGPNRFDGDAPPDGGRVAVVAQTSDAGAQARRIIGGGAVRARHPDEILLATYKAPQDRPASFGRRKQAA
jgi:uncharacterized membrane protein YhaH (DUF805 family)